MSLSVWFGCCLAWCCSRHRYRRLACCGCCNGRFCSHCCDIVVIIFDGADLVVGLVVVVVVVAVVIVAVVVANAVIVVVTVLVTVFVVVAISVVEVLDVVVDVEGVVVIIIGL